MMMYYTVKIVLTTLLIVSISELSKRNALIAALLASLPLVSILAMLWLFIDTHDVNRVAELACDVCGTHRCTPSVTMSLNDSASCSANCSVRKGEQLMSFT